MSDDLNSTDVEGATPGHDVEAQPKKKKGLKTLLIVVVVLVVVIGAGTAGLLIWHEQPTFCNAICHTPMDPYVESFEKNVSIQPFETDISATLGVTVHKESDQKVECLNCHVPTIGEQLTEGIKWVTGDYEVPLAMMKYDGVEFCLRPECHEGVTSQDELKAVFASETRNVHNSHMGNIDCNKCHRVHEQSVLICTQCHSDIDVPDGWLTDKEYTALQKAGA